MMTDVWCFTCSHEIRETLDGWVHAEPGDADGECECTALGLRCEP